jgi:hypothetical protein
MLNIIFRRMIIRFLFFFLMVMYFPYALSSSQDKLIDDSI